MRITAPPGAVVIWLAASIVAVLSCSLYFSAAHLNGEYLPVGNDSVYHARRILDTVQDPASFYQFDPKIHAPEGSLLVWPWGYDYMMAQIVRLGLAVGLSSDPLAILIWLPVAAVCISIALLVLLGRRLGLSMWPTALAALSMATAPTTQFLHGAGQIDHHFAEMIMILAALAVGLKWFREPDNPRAAAALAAVLGLAQAIHNGMFILQLPLLVTLFLRWTQGINAPRRPAATFAAVLLAATLAALIPSMAFRTLRFEFYTLSWFHLYIAFCTASSVLLLSFLPRSRRNVAALAGWGLLLVIPILTQIRMAQSFVAGTMKWLETISEMKSPLDAAFTSIGAQIISMMYSYLIWLLPFTLLLCIWYGWRERANPRLYFWVAATAGLALLTTQVRMHYFGDFALYLPWLILVDEYAKAHPPAARKTFLTTSLALVLLYVPVLRHQVIAPVSMANDPTFEDTRPLYTTLRKACAEDPGIVLADNNAGHYIRYYTDCSVLVNNFLLTPLHFSKMDEVARLFSLHARELAAAAPEVKYVLIRPLDVRRARNPQEGYKYWFFFPGMQHLAYDLLLDQSGPPPPELMMIDEVRFPEVDNIPYARLFKIRRDRAAVGTSSVGE